MNQTETQKSKTTDGTFFEAIRPLVNWVLPAAVTARIRKCLLRKTESSSLSPGTAEMEHLIGLPRDQHGKAVMDGQTFFFTDSKTFLHEYHQIFRNQCYDFPCSHASPRIIDCGANVGMACRYWLTQYPDAHVTAFEPDPFIFEVLQANLAAIDPAQIELHHAALWKTESTMSFTVTGSESGHLSKIDSLPAGEEISVKTMTLSSFLNQEIEFLKIDIEGAEADVLVEAKEKLGNVKSIWIEYHSLLHSTQRLSEILAVLEQQGFRYHIVPESVSPKPLRKLEAAYGMDQRLNIWAVRGDRFPVIVELENESLASMAEEAVPE